MKNFHLPAFFIKLLPKIIKITFDHKLPLAQQKIKQHAVTRRFFSPTKHARFTSIHKRIVILLYEEGKRQNEYFYKLATPEYWWMRSFPSVFFPWGALSSHADICENISQTFVKVLQCVEILLFINVRVSFLSLWT